MNIPTPLSYKQKSFIHKTTKKKGKQRISLKQQLGEALEEIRRAKERQLRTDIHVEKLIKEIYSLKREKSFLELLPRKKNK